jgi:hypothetical protein
MRNFWKIKKKLIDSSFIRNVSSEMANMTTMEDAKNSENREETEEMEDKALKKEEEKEKSRHRKRGPYRKAHADW